VIRTRLSSAAERDVLAAQKWYARQGTGLDLSFRDELDHVLNHIRIHPASFPVVHNSVRRANLQRFPYGVFYVLRRSHVLILGVVHHARHPGRWMTR
jgi:plasmid stabilization system protein ParE